jgi:hypothetical protein
MPAKETIGMKKLAVPALVLALALGACHKDADDTAATDTATTEPMPADTAMATDTMAPADTTTATSTATAPDGTTATTTATDAASATPTSTASPM